MSNVVRTDIDALNAVLTVTLPKEEYVEKVQREIKKYAQKTAVRGFRPGKTPQSLIKRLYGVSFMMDVVNDTLNAKLYEYLQEAQLETLGQPVLAADQSELKYNINRPEDLVFKFEVGLAPQFELAGLEGVTYERYEVAVDADKIDAEFEQARKQAGAEVDADDTLLETDVVTLQAKEVGGSLETEIVVSVQWLTDDMKEVFLSQKKGDQLTINVFQLEKETTAEYVRKYLLKMDENDTREINENFDVVISKVTRVVPAEVNEAFLTRAFGPGVTTEEAAREIIRKNLSAAYEGQSDALLLRDFQDKLMAANPLELPEAFLRRWLKTQNEKNTDEVIEAQFESFANNLRWTMIRSQIAKKANIEVSQQDMADYYAAKVRSYFGNMPANEDLVNSLVERVMSDEKQASELYEDVLMEKTLTAMKNMAHLTPKVVSLAEFESIMATAKYEAAKARGEVKEAEEVVAD